MALEHFLHLKFEISLSSTYSSLLHAVTQYVKLDLRNLSVLGLLHFMQEHPKARLHTLQIAGVVTL